MLPVRPFYVRRVAPREDPTRSGVRLREIGMRVESLFRRQARRVTTARALAVEDRVPSLANPFAIEQESNTGATGFVPDLASASQ
jgi:hypothetical protein